MTSEKLNPNYLIFKTSDAEQFQKGRMVRSLKTTLDVSMAIEDYVLDFAPLLWLQTFNEYVLGRDLEFRLDVNEG